MPGLSHAGKDLLPLRLELHEDLKPALQYVKALLHLLKQRLTALLVSSHACIPQLHITQEMPLISGTCSQFLTVWPAHVQEPCAGQQGVAYLYTKASKALRAKAG